MTPALRVGSALAGGPALELEVVGLSSAEDVVIRTLYASAESRLRDSGCRATVEARPLDGRARFVFRPGLPREPRGVSRDAQTRLGPRTSPAR